MNKEVFVKSVSDLQSGDKKDGSGKWYARDIVLQANDNTLYRDEFLVRITGEDAKTAQIDVGRLYMAEMSFSVRQREERTYQEIWLKSLMPATNPAESFLP